MPAKESWKPVPLGAQAASWPPGRKSLPIAVDGSVTRSSGTSRATQATKVFEFGPGQVT